MAEDSVIDALETSAQGPRRAAADGISSEQHSLPDQIAADRYVRAKTAVHADPRTAFTRVKIVPPGTV